MIQIFPGVRNAATLLWDTYSCFALLKYLDLNPSKFSRQSQTLGNGKGWKKKRKRKEKEKWKKKKKEKEKGKRKDKRKQKKKKRPGGVGDQI